MRKTETWLTTLYKGSRRKQNTQNIKSIFVWLLKSMVWNILHVVLQLMAVQYCSLSTQNFIWSDRRGNNRIWREWWREWNSEVPRRLHCTLALAKNEPSTDTEKLSERRSAIPLIVIVSLPEFQIPGLDSLRFCWNLAYKSAFIIEKIHYFWLITVPSLILI